MRTCVGRGGRRGLWFVPAVGHGEGAVPEAGDHVLGFPAVADDLGYVLALDFADDGALVAVVAKAVVGSLEVEHVVEVGGLMLHVASPVVVDAVVVDFDDAAFEGVEVSEEGVIGVAGHVGVADVEVDAPAFELIAD